MGGRRARVRRASQALRQAAAARELGIGRATYDASQEIRSGEIDREEGIALIKRFDGEFPERFADDVFRYLSIGADEFPEAVKMFAHPEMNREYFDALADSFRPPHIWARENGEWRLRSPIF